MCYRVHDLDRPREKAAQQHTPTTLSLRPRLDERWAALMAWLRPSAKPATPVTATAPAQAKLAEAAAKGLTVLPDGSGVARVQYPAPGSPLHQGDRIRVEFKR